MSPQHIADGVLTLAEAAAFLKVSEAIVLTEAESEQLPGRLLGTEWRFSRAGILAWLAVPPGLRPWLPPRPIEPWDEVKQREVDQELAEMAAIRATFNAWGADTNSS